MVKKNPRFRHRFGFSGNSEKKSEDSVTHDDIVNSLNRQYGAPGQDHEPGTGALEETAQSVESYESGGSSRHRRSKLLVATLTLLGAPIALWLSGLLPAPVVGIGDAGLDYIVSQATSLGPILLGEIATIGLVIIVLRKHMHHESSGQKQ